MSREKEKTTFGTQFVLVSALIFVILGLTLLFVPKIGVLNLCYMLSAVIVAAGVIMIVKYFMTDAFRNLNEYGFSEGVLLLILGMCALVRAKEVSGYFVLVLGIFILLSSITKIQYALDLKRMEDKIWAIQLVAGLCLTVCAVVIMMNLFSDEKVREVFACYVLVVDGALTLLGNLYLSIRVKRYEKELAKPRTQEEPEDETWTQLNEEMNHAEIQDSMEEPAAKEIEE